MDRLQINIPVILDLTALDGLKAQVAQLSNDLKINLTVDTGGAGGAGLDGMQKDVDGLAHRFEDLKGVQIDAKKGMDDLGQSAGGLSSNLGTLGQSQEEMSSKFRGAGQEVEGLAKSFTLLTKGQASTTQLAGKVSDEYDGMQVKSKSLNHTLGEMEVVLRKNAQENVHVKSKLTETADSAGNVSTKFDEMSRSTKTATGQSMGLVASFTEGLKKTVIWAGAMTAFYGTLRQVQSGVKFIFEMDKEMTNLKKVAEGTNNEFKAFEKTANNLAKTLGASTVDVTKSATEFSRLGFSLQQASVLAKEALIFANVGNFGIDDATKGLISTIKGFGIEVDDYGLNVRKIIDIQNEVANNYAISQEGLSSALQRSASSLHTAGNTIEQSVAMITAANAVMQNPEKVGNAMKTVTMRLRGIGEAGEDLSGMMPKLEENFSKFGITLKKDDQTFKSTYDIFNELAKVWQDISDFDQAEMLEKIAGKHQGAVIAGMLNNWKDAQAALETGLNSQGSAMQEFSIYMEGAEYKLGIFQATLEGFWQSFLSADFFKGLVSSGTTLLGVLDKMVNELGFLQSIGLILAPLIGVKLVSGFHGLITVMRTAAGASLALQSANIVLLAALVSVTAVLGIIGFHRQKEEEQKENLLNVTGQEINALYEEGEALASLQTRYDEANGDMALLSGIKDDLIAINPELISQIGDETDGYAGLAESIKGANDSYEGMSKSYKENKLIEAESVLASIKLDEEALQAKINNNLETIRLRKKLNSQGADEIESLKKIQIRTAGYQENLATLNDERGRAAQLVERLGGAIANTSDQILDNSEKMYNNTGAMVENANSTYNVTDANGELINIYQVKNGQLVLNEDAVRQLSATEIEAVQASLNAQKASLEAEQQYSIQKIKMIQAVIEARWAEAESAGASPMGRGAKTFIPGKTKAHKKQGLGDFLGYKPLKFTKEQKWKMMSPTQRTLKNNATIELNDAKRILGIQTKSLNNVNKIMGQVSKISTGASANVKGMGKASTGAGKAAAGAGKAATGAGKAAKTAGKQASSAADQAKKSTDGAKKSTDEAKDSLTDLTSATSAQQGLVDDLENAYKHLNNTMKKLDSQMDNIIKGSQEERDIIQAKVRLLEEESTLIEEKAEAQIKAGKVVAKENQPSGSKSGGSNKGGTGRPQVNGYELPFYDYGQPVTSQYGMRNGRMHQGVDIGLKNRSILLSTKEGTVEYSRVIGGGGGYATKIKHNDGSFARYMHMIPGSGLKAGTKVKQGQQIGLSGGVRNAPGSGSSTGPHLHFEIWEGNTHVNPSGVISGARKGSSSSSSSTKKSSSSSSTKKSSSSGSGGGAKYGGHDLNSQSGRERYTWAYLKGQGFTDQAAAGIMGNLDHEAPGINPKTHQGGGGPGRGIMQWTKNVRWKSLLAYAKKNKSDPLHLKTQLDFMMHEMNTPSYAKSLANRGGLNSKNTNDAMRLFEVVMEGAGTKHYDKRGASASKYYKTFKGTTGSTGSSSGSGSGSKSSGGALTDSEYKWAIETMGEAEALGIMLDMESRQIDIATLKHQLGKQFEESKQYSAHIKPLEDLDKQIALSEKRMALLDQDSVDYKYEIENQIKLEEMKQTHMAQHSAYLRWYIKSEIASGQMLQENKDKLESLNSEVLVSKKIVEDLEKSVKDLDKSIKDNIQKTLDEVADAYNKIYTAQKEDSMQFWDKYIEKQTDALQKLNEVLDEQLDIYNKLIDAKIEALDEKEDEDDYNKALKEMQDERNKTIDEKNKRMLDDSRESKAIQKELEEKLIEQEDAIREKQHKRSIELQKKALNDLKKNKGEEVKVEKESNEEWSKLLIDSYKDAKDRSEEYYDNLIKTNTATTKIMEDILAGHFENVEEDYLSLIGFLSENKELLGDAYQPLIDKIGEALNLTEKLNRTNQTFLSEHGTYYKKDDEGTWKFTPDGKEIFIPKGDSREEYLPMEMGGGAYTVDGTSYVQHDDGSRTKYRDDGTSVRLDPSHKDFKYMKPPPGQVDNPKSNKFENTFVDENGTKYTKYDNGDVFKQVKGGVGVLIPYDDPRMVHIPTQVGGGNPRHETIGVVDTFKKGDLHYTLHTNDSVTKRNMKTGARVTIAPGSKDMDWIPIEIGGKYKDPKKDYTDYSNKPEPKHNYQGQENIPEPKPNNNNSSNNNSSNNNSSNNRKNDTIDNKGNIYIRNPAGLVVRQSPDGSVTVLEKGDSQIPPELNYHKGGIVGGQSFNPQTEEIAKLLKGELVLNEKQLMNIPNVVSGLAKSMNGVDRQGSSDVSNVINVSMNIDKLTGDKTGGKEMFSTFVDSLRGKGVKLT